MVFGIWHFCLLILKDTLIKVWKAQLMEALLLFLIYRVWDLKASQITMRWNNDVLGLFFTWYTQVSIGFWVRWQFSVPERSAGPWRLAACYHFLVKVMDCGGRRGEEKTKGRRGRRRGRKKASKPDFLTRHKFLLRNISAVRPITAMTQRALWSWCMYRKICGELQSPCPFALFPPNLLSARHTQIFQ